MNLRHTVAATCVAVSAIALSARAQSDQEQPLPRAARPALAPILVSITAKDAPIEDVFAQLQKQAQVHFAAAAPGTPRRVTLDVHDQPLWEVLKAALDQLPTAPLAAWKMDAGDTSASPGLADYKGVLSAHGPFLLIAGAAEHEFNFQRPEDSAERVTLLLQLVTDTSVSVITRPNWPRVLKATFENGDPLVDSNASTRDAALFTTEVRGSIPIYLNPVRPSTIRHTRLAVVEGEIPTDVVAATTTVELPLPGSLTVPYLDQNVTITSEAARPAPGAPRSGAAAGPPAASVRLQLKFPPADPPVPQVQQILLSRALGTVRATATDDRGNVLWTTQRTQATPGSTASPLRVELTLTAAAGAPLPKKITLQLPTAMAQIKIPFHFENIPLP